MDDICIEEDTYRDTINMVKKTSLNECYYYVLSFHAE